MKILLLLGLSLNYLFCFSQHNNEWAYLLDGNLELYCNDIAVDNQGGIYLAGRFEGTVDFDPGSPSVNETASGQDDAFIAKYTSNMQLEWVKTFGALGNSNTIGATVKVDSFGDVYFAGYFTDTVDFDPGIGTYEMIPETIVGNSFAITIFFLKLNSQGDFIWAKQMGGNWGNYDTYYEPDIELTSNNVYLSGRFIGTADLDPGPGTAIYNAGQSEEDIFILNLEYDGTFNWVKVLDGTGSAVQTKSITTDINNNVYVIGGYSESIDLDPGIGQYTLSNSSGNSQLFILKLNDLGDFVWGRELSSSAVSTGLFIDCHSVDSIYIGGYFTGDADFDLGSGTLMFSAGNGMDFFISKLDSAGTIYETNIIFSGNPFEYIPYDVDLSNNGEALIAVAATSTLLIDPNNTSIPFQPAAGLPGACIVRLDNSGNLFEYDTISNSYGEAITSGEFGETYYALQTFNTPVELQVSGTPTNYSSTGDVNALIGKWSGTIGIEQIELKFDCHIYPNPSNETIWVETDEKIEQVTLLNAVGEVCLQGDPTKPNQIDIQNLKPGIYIIDISSKNNGHYKSRIVIQ